MSLEGFLAMEVLSQPQLKRLKEHKYSAEGKSITEPVMQVFWCWLVEQVPRTVAPNTITLVGLAANIISTLILAFYCPTATEMVCYVISASLLLSCSLKINIGPYKCIINKGLFIFLSNFAQLRSRRCCDL